MKKYGGVSHAKYANIIKVRKFYLPLVHFSLLLFDRVVRDTKISFDMFCQKIRNRIKIFN